MNSFSLYLQQSVGKINKELDSLLLFYRAEIEKKEESLLNLYDHFVECNNGGRRFRGTLVRLGYDLTGSKGNGQILKPAVAYELFQTAILVHDDIIDQSPLRRGKPSLYQALGGNHYGVSQAICLGDLGFFLMYQILSETKFSPERKNQALTYFSQVVLDTTLGEMFDIELPFLKRVKKETDVIKLSILKTAQYTVVGPMQLGAILGGADKKLLANIKQFGESLGIAFQIHDDIIGVFGEQESIGKSNTSDVEEGKLTLLYLFALSHVNTNQKKVLTKYYGKGKIGQDGLKFIRQVFIDTKALEYARQNALNYINNAKSLIPKITKNKRYRQLLLELTEYLAGKI